MGPRVTRDSGPGCSGPRSRLSHQPRATALTGLRTASFTAHARTRTTTESQHMRGHARPQSHSTREDTHDRRVTCCGHSWTCTHMSMHVHTSTRECLCTRSHVCLQEHTDTREHTHNRRVTDTREHTHNLRITDTREHTHNHRVTDMHEHTHNNRITDMHEHTHNRRVTDTREHTHNRRITDTHEHTHNRRVTDMCRRQAWTGTCRCPCMRTRSHRCVYAPVAVQVCMCGQALIQRHRAHVCTMHTHKQHLRTHI